jgi:UDPglucose 6-dehydrogenase
MEARFKQTEWLADLMMAHDLPKAIVGYSFKAESNLTVGSPALLLASILQERGVQPLMYDPYVDEPKRDLSTLSPHVFLIGAKHRQLASLVFPKGSVVIDPWRYLPPQDGVSLISIGVGSEA